MINLRRKMNGQSSVNGNLMVSRRIGTALVGLVAVVSMSACARVPGVYVYERSGSKAGGSSAAFEPKAYVDGIWSSKIVPTVHEKAVDVTTLATAIAEDPEGAGKKYGHRAGTGSPYAYVTKGSGTVTKVDTSAPTGPVTVRVPTAAGGKPVTVTVITGPVIAGTALRDGVGFISFGDFTNQIAYADVANQINAKVKADVTSKVDVKGLTGKKVTFYGAFSALIPGQILLVPTELQVMP
jgi:predicted lipoprotein